MVRDVSSVDEDDPIAGTSSVMVGVSRWVSCALWCCRQVNIM